MKKYTIAILGLLLLAAAYTTPHTAFAAVTNYFGIELGKEAPYSDGGGGGDISGGCSGASCHLDIGGSIGGGSGPTCYTDDNNMLTGNPVYAPNITGSWSVFAQREPCRSGNVSNIGYLWLYISGKDIPAQTDIRICIQATDKLVAAASDYIECTKYASEGGSGWINTDWAYFNAAKTAPDGFRIRVDSRSLYGRSITDVRLQASLIKGGAVSPFITTPWSSQGGGWYKNSYDIIWPTGSGNDSNGAQIGMQVKMVNVPVPDLTAWSPMLASGALLQTTTVKFKSIVKNTGTAATGKAFLTQFQYHWGASGAWVNMGAAVSDPALNKSALKDTLSPSFALAKAGVLVVRACADSSNLVGEVDEADNCSGAKSFTVAAPTPALVPQSVSRGGTLAAGEVQTFTGRVKNTGTGASSASTGTGRFCYDNASCATSGTHSFNSAAIPALAVGATSGAITGTWVATAGTHVVYFCVVNRGCVNTGNFTVAAPSGDCTVTTSSGTRKMINHGPALIMYSTDLTPEGQSCQTGKDGQGRLYAESLTCNNGAISGWASPSLYTHFTCVQGSPPSTQSDISLAVSSDLVRAGGSVLLTWSGGNATSCLLQGTNGFSSSALGGSGVSSGPITQKSTFTLTCTLASNQKQMRAAVNIIPTVQEI